MPSIIKTWPSFMSRKKTLEVFTHDWGRFFFTLGRGKPKKTVDRIYFTHCGRIIGSFAVGEIVINNGDLPKLRSLSDQESEWQIKPDRWVAICPPPFTKLSERLYHEGFRGWHYFDLEEYRGYLSSKVRI
jgi:hypothetical protein